MPLRRLAVPAFLTAAVLFSACGAAHPANPARGARIVHVVAGENVWGDIARQIGGAHVAVTSILSDPSADPHLYSSDPHDAGEIAIANLVIVNGLGYDDFMNKLLATTSGRGRTVLTVADVLHAHGADADPHLWYDVTGVPAVAAAIERALARADPADAPRFAGGLARFDRGYAPVRRTVAAIRARDRGAPVAYTERVPGYLLGDAGLTIRTPAGFAAAIEDGNEPSPADTEAMESAITRRQVNVLLYNAQAESAVTKHVRALARQNGIPIVAVTETLPPAFATFQAWQLHQARALQGALGGAR